MFHPIPAARSRPDEVAGGDRRTRSFRRHAQGSPVEAGWPRDRQVPCPTGLQRASLTSFELDPHKVALARETFRLAGVDDVIEVVHADARQALEAVDRISFCFLDAEKNVYTACHALVLPRMVTGSWLLADNAISHRDELGEFLPMALEDSRTDATIVPVGKGVLVARVR